MDNRERPRGDRRLGPLSLTQLTDREARTAAARCQSVTHAAPFLLLLFSGGSPRLPSAAVQSRPADHRRVRRRCPVPSPPCRSRDPLLLASASPSPASKTRRGEAPEVPSGSTSKQTSTRGHHTWLMSNRRRVAFGSSSARLSRSNLSFMTTTMQLCPSTSPLHMETCLFLKLSPTLNNEHGPLPVSKQNYYAPSL
ncbi:uncharacterized protein [Aegilops tauschii subsp. strangulata]|uniref:uncharacterized protein n=1 Tax=Aegilops tauschii subsp. strangulata TaxID=200361 RepID=UPI001E1CAC64|nr:uncharacterized protein LOC120967211 [Aegilops tauschii subsp. strangulata]